MTVCPPKDSFLNLNHDIQRSENVKLDNDTRKELLDYAMDKIQDEFYKEIMTNLSKVEDPDRYFNWYHGYTKIRYPYYSSIYNQLKYNVDTSTTSGNISTKFFGDKFDANKVDGNIHIIIRVYVPSSVKGDQNNTLMFDIKKKTMEELSDNDKIYISGGVGYIDADLTHWSKNITAPSSSYQIYLSRKVSADDINNLKLEMMLGFRLTWNYNEHVEPKDTFSSLTKTKQFAR